MRTFLIAVIVVAVALVLLGALFEAVKWLIAVGLVALVVAVVAGVVQARTRQVSR